VSLGQFTELMESLANVTPTIERVVDQLNDASGRFGNLVERNRGNIDQELSDLNVLLTIVDENLGPLDTVTKNLKEVLLATARTQSYGKWWTLYVVNLCPELGTERCTGLIDGAP
jgi:ABC-type transporter Mla subunit MlaD